MLHPCVSTWASRSGSGDQRLRLVSNCPRTMEERPDGRACEQNHVSFCGRGLSRVGAWSARGSWLVAD